jgi:hypothetical protein
VRGRFEVLLAWDVSQLGRSLRELLACFETLRRTGGGLYLDQQFEISMLIEQSRTGLDRAGRASARTGSRGNRHDKSFAQGIRQAVVALT